MQHLMTTNAFPWWCRNTFRGVTLRGTGKKRLCTTQHTTFIRSGFHSWQWSDHVTKPRDENQVWEWCVVRGVSMAEPKISRALKPLRVSCPSRGGVTWEMITVRDVRVSRHGNELQFAIRQLNVAGSSWQVVWVSDQSSREYVTHVMRRPHS